MKKSLLLTILATMALSFGVYARTYNFTVVSRGAAEPALAIYSGMATATAKPTPPSEFATLGQWQKIDGAWYFIASRSYIKNDSGLGNIINANSEAEYVALYNPDEDGTIFLMNKNELPADAAQPIFNNTGQRLYRANNIIIIKGKFITDKDEISIDQARALKLVNNSNEILVLGKRLGAKKVNGKIAFNK